MRYQKSKQQQIWDVSFDKELNDAILYEPSFISKTTYSDHYDYLESKYLESKYEDLSYEDSTHEVNYEDYQTQCYYGA